ncbi:MAG: conjugal transfer protein TraF [Magnetococcales bacterium]|nr:conjugal transfer protein TraF [Magnetococcales bacterium]NGZ25394.1 conjugal transfer protein TraF [Magnetococcales bacterium]
MSPAMNVSIFRFMVLFILTFWLAQQASSDSFFSDHERGWFWYESPPVEEVPEEELLLPTPPSPPAGQTDTVPLSAAWLREQLPKFRDMAIDQPSAENVAVYLALQKVAMDKSNRFSDAAQLAVMSEPWLDENNTRSIATFGALVMDETAQAGLDEAVKMIADKVGIWFFYESTCPYCVSQAGVLSALAKSHGLKVMAISMDGLPLPGSEFRNFIRDEGHARKLGVTTTPTMMLFQAPSEFAVLSQGLMAGDEIMRRLIWLGHAKGWLTDAQFSRTRPFRKNHGLTEVVGQVDQVDFNNPKKILEWFRLQNNLHSQKQPGR